MEELSLYDKLQMKIVIKALKRSCDLLERDHRTLSYEHIHSVKSTLYAAIGQVGTRIERLSSVQRMLRELFVVVTSNAELKKHEREIASQIIAEIKERYGAIIGLSEHELAGKSL